MTIKTHTESSKMELSSGGKRPFKVWRFFSKLIFLKKLFETLTTKLFELEFLEFGFNIKKAKTLAEVTVFLNRFRHRMSFDALR